MSYLDALELVVARTGHERYRQLCSDNNPEMAQRVGYRELVIRLAATPAAPPDPIARLDAAYAAAGTGAARGGCGKC